MTTLWKKKKKKKIYKKKKNFSLFDDLLFELPARAIKIKKNEINKNALYYHSFF